MNTYFAKQPDENGQWIEISKRAYDLLLISKKREVKIVFLKLFSEPNS
jgi:hypothetical protein